MGSVYRGRHTKLDRAVAIKILHDHHVNEPVVLARFQREAQAAARLSHPNLVGVVDVGETGDGRPVMIMEYAQGPTLRDLMLGPMPRDKIVPVLKALLAGLDHAHAAGL